MATPNDVPTLAVKSMVDSTPEESGQVEEYCTAILDDESWVYVNPG